MPQMDGVEVMGRLGALNCESWLILTSGVGKQALETARQSAELHNLNVIGTLPKPFKRSELKHLLTVGRLSENRVPGSAGSNSEPVERDQTVLKNELREAIRTSSIDIALQPKIACRTGTLAGFEVLARWQSGGNKISPDRFIAMAESDGLIDELTWVVFEKALSALGHLRDRQHLAPIIPKLSLSINLSVLTLPNRELFQRMVVACENANLKRSQIVFELTESSAMSDPVKSFDTLTRLQLEGFAFSIDDFGTGYSSMVQLVRLPFSEIKVDKSFVINAAESGESKAIIRSIVQLGKSLDLATTAEGVEDSQTMEYLRSEGCDLAQGYFIGRPMPAEEIPAWFTDREAYREAARVSALRQSGLVEEASEKRFSRLTSLVSRYFGVPDSLVTFLDDNTQWIKSCGVLNDQEVPRFLSVCDTTIRSDVTLVIKDLREDPGFAGIPAVVEDGLRFYAGHPICLPGGEKAGALCILDYEPRDFSSDERAALEQFAGLVELQIKANESSDSSGFSNILSREPWYLQASDFLRVYDRLRIDACLCVVVLSSLGSINRVYGRVAGDRILNKVAELFGECVGIDNLAGRTRGSELSAVCAQTPEQVQAMLAIFHHKLKESLETDPAWPDSFKLLYGVAAITSSGSPGLSEALEIARTSATSSTIQNLG